MTSAFDTPPTGLPPTRVAIDRSRAEDVSHAAVSWLVSARAAAHALGEPNGQRPSAEAVLTIDAAISADGSARCAISLRTPGGDRVIEEQTVDGASVRTVGRLRVVEVGGVLRAAIEGATDTVVWASTDAFSRLGIGGGMYEVRGLAEAE